MLINSFLYNLVDQTLSRLNKLDFSCQNLWACHVSSSRLIEHSG
jgi:hypothetical protein